MKFDNLKVKKDKDELKLIKNKKFTGLTSIDKIIDKIGEYKININNNFDIKSFIEFYNKNKESFFLSSKDLLNKLSNIESVKDPQCKLL